MTIPPSYSDSPRNITSYSGQTYAFAPIFYRKRDPTSLDLRPKEAKGYYPIGSMWYNTVGLNIWFLAEIKAVNGATNAFWVQLVEGANTGPMLTLSDNAGTVVHPSLDSSTPPGNIQFLSGAGIQIVGDNTLHTMTITNTGSGTETLKGDDGVAVSPDGGGSITTVGSVVANSTNGKALYVKNTGANTETWQIQLSAAIGATNVAKVGLAAFNSAQFSVDANGFVSLAGAVSPLGLTPDASTPPGTSPVVQNGSGNIKLEGGSTFATGTQANPIRTNSLAANTMDFQIQLAGANAAVSTANNFGVSQFDSNSFGVASGFVTLKNGGTTGAVTAVQGDDSLSVVPSSGTITWTGATVANGTNVHGPVTFKKNAASTEELDVQVAAAIAATDITKVGLAAFKNTQFTVDANGFVSLSASTIVGLVPDAISGTGTSPTLPNGAGNLTLQGSIVAAHSIPLRTISDSVNTIHVQAQYAAAVGATDGTKAGMAVFNSNDFTVDASGFVSLIGGSTSPAVTSVALDVATTPINPTAGGQLTLTGGQVATGVVGANVIRTRGNTANSATIEIQRSTVSAASDSTKNGVCHFDSSKFGVDANGFVTFTGSTSNIPWTDEGGNFNAASNNGYFCTALLTATLPATPAQGDIIKFVMDTASVVTVTANAGQKIRMGNTISALAGTCASTRQGDSMELVYRAASATWYAYAGSTGSWTIT